MSAFMTASVPTPTFSGGGPAPFTGYTGPLTPNHPAFSTPLAMTGVDLFPLFFAAVLVGVVGVALAFVAHRARRLHRF